MFKKILGTLVKNYLDYICRFFSQFFFRLGGVVPPPQMLLTVKVCDYRIYSNKHPGRLSIFLTIWGGAFIGEGSVLERCVYSKHSVLDNLLQANYRFSISFLAKIYTLWNSTVLKIHF